MAHGLRSFWVRCNRVLGGERYGRGDALERRKGGGMMEDINHSDLSDCPCGAGKPDVTQLFQDALYVITCTCGAECAAWSEAQAVAEWNDGVRAYEAAA